MGKALVKPDLKKNVVLKLLDIIDKNAGKLGIDNFVIFVRTKSGERFLSCSNDYNITQTGTTDLDINGSQLSYQSGVTYIPGICNKCNSPLYISTRSNKCCTNKTPGSKHSVGYFYCTTCCNWIGGQVPPVPNPYSANCDKDNYLGTIIQWKCTTPSCAGKCRGKY